MKVKICFLGLATIVALVGNVEARTLIQVELTTSKGCKIIDHNNPEKEHSKLIRLDWSGICKDGYAEGDGTYKANYEDGSVEIVTGHFAKGKGEGLVSGEKSLPDGTKYKINGFHKSGLPSGIGEMIVTKPNGDVAEYKGNFEAGLPHGFGTLKTPQFTYTGNFEERKPKGIGKLDIAGGTTYEGELDEKFKPHGRGSMTYTSGDTFVGTFTNGKPDGDGFIERKDGQRVAVTVEDGKLKRKMQEPAQAQTRAQPAEVNNNAAIDACKAKVYSIPASNFFESVANASLCESNPNAWANIKPPAQHTLQPSQPMPNRQPSNINCRWIGRDWVCNQY
jgi:hypothetical protein